MRRELLPLAALLLLTAPHAPGPAQEKPPRDAPAYTDHQDLLYHLDAAGRRQPVRSAEDWEVRRRHVLAGMRRVLGDLPGEARRVPLDVKQAEEVKLGGGLVRRKI